MSVAPRREPRVWACGLRQPLLCSRQGAEAPALQWPEGPALAPCACPCSAVGRGQWLHAVETLAECCGLGVETLLTYCSLVGGRRS